MFSEVEFEGMEEIEFERMEEIDFLNKFLVRAYTSAKNLSKKSRCPP